MNLNHEVPLIAQVGAARRVVGRILPATAIVRRAPAAALVAVTLPDEGFSPRSRLLVPASALQGRRGNGG